MNTGITPFNISASSQVATTQTTKNFVNLYSCYPSEFKLDSGPLGDSYAPACPPDKLYTKFRVYEVKQPCYMGKSSPDELSGGAVYHYETVTHPAMEIATDFVQRHGKEFGIFLSDAPDGGEPSDECVRAARLGMVNKMASVVSTAENDWEANHDRRRITDRAREAARFLGANVAWIDPAKDVNLASAVTMTQAARAAAAAALAKAPVARA